MKLNFFCSLKIVFEIRSAQFSSSTNIILNSVTVHVTISLYMYTSKCIMLRKILPLDKCEFKKKQLKQIIFEHNKQYFIYVLLKNYLLQDVNCNVDRIALIR